MIRTIKNILLSVWYLVSSSHFRQLRKSPIFNPEYYRDSNSDVAATGVNPLVHYLTCGFAELRNPGPLFDSHYYAKQIPAFKENGLDPLLHFLEEGYRVGSKPNIQFDPSWYMQNNTDVDFSTINPLVHYLEQGDGASPSLYFDSAYYKKTYQDVSPGLYHPLVHYLTIGMRERRQPSLYFDMPWYLDKTPVLLESKMDPLSHYFDFGIEEYKSPSPLFDPLFYAATTYGVAESGDLFTHYMQYGAPLDQRPCSWFDPAFYRRCYLEKTDDPTVPLAHYLSNGVAEGLYPNQDVADLSEKPVISLLVPVYNVTSAHLNNCIRSILYQSYPHWELCLVDDCSSRKKVRPLLEQWALRDSRIKVHFLDENQGIAGATNAAAEFATGSYLGFLDNDDELTPDCLFAVVQKINSENADLYYSDEDLIGEDGRQFSVFNKPDFNKELLLSHNYITHFVVTRKSLYEQVGGFDRALDGAQDFDLFLKLSEQAENIIHIAEVLYHWRASESSTSINHDEKQYANEAGRRAVANALLRRGIGGQVTLTDWKFFYRIQRDLAEMPRISIIIFYQVLGDFKGWFSGLIAGTGYSNTEFLIVVDNEQQLLFLQQLTDDFGQDIRLLLIPGEECFAARYNRAVGESRGDYTVFLNSCVQLQDSNWIEAMLEYAMAENSGVVGGRILPYQEQECIATVPDLSQQGDFYYAKFVQQCSQHMNGLQCGQNVRALSWDLAMVQRERFLAIGGFSENYSGKLFADSDLCFQMYEQGKDNVYTPFVLGQWLLPEEEVQGTVASSSGTVKSLFQKKWYSVLSCGDPFYNFGILDQNDISQNQFLRWYAGEASQ